MFAALGRSRVGNIANEVEISTDVPRLEFAGQSVHQLIDY
jgi:hypothetical protein